MALLGTGETVLVSFAMNSKSIIAHQFKDGGGYAEHVDCNANLAMKYDRQVLSPEKAGAIPETFLTGESSNKCFFSRFSSSFSSNFQSLNSNSLPAAPFCWRV